MLRTPPKLQQCSGRKNTLQGQEEQVHFSCIIPISWARMAHYEDRTPCLMSAPLQKERKQGEQTIFPSLLGHYPNDQLQFHSIHIAWETNIAEIPRDRVEKRRGIGSISVSHEAGTITVPTGLLCTALQLTSLLMTSSTLRVLMNALQLHHSVHHSSPQELVLQNTLEAFPLRKLTARIAAANPLKFLLLRTLQFFCFCFFFFPTQSPGACAATPALLILYSNQLLLLRLTYPRTPENRLHMCPQMALGSLPLAWFSYRQM